MEDQEDFYLEPSLREQWRKDSQTRASTQAAPNQEFGVQSGPVDMPPLEMFKKAAQNLPSSLVDVAKSTIHPILHPIETGESIYGLGKALGAKGMLKAFDALGRPVTPEARAEVEKLAEPATAVGEYYSERYGSGPARKVTFATDPAGMISDLSIPFTLGGGMAARVPGVIGKVGEAARVTGSYMDPITLGLKGTEKAMELGAKYPAAFAASVRSGASFGSLQDAFDAGYHANPEFFRHLTGKGSQQEVIDSVTQAVRDIAKDRSDAYIRDMGGLNQLNQLSYGNILNTLDAAKKANLAPGGIKNNATAAALADAEAKINQWRTQQPKAGSHTIADLDGLKQAIDEIRSNYSVGDKAYAALTNVRKSIFNTIAAADPGYAKVMESYADASRRLGDLRNEFRVNSDIPVNKKMRAILRARDTVHGDNFIEQLATKNPDIPYMIAGQELKKFWPYGSIRKTEGLGEIGGHLAKSLYTGFDPTWAAIHAVTLPFASPATNAVALSTAGALTRGVGAVGDVSSKVPMFVKAPLYGAGRIAEETADDEPYPLPPARPNRATGGRITAEGLLSAAERAKKEVNKTTEPLLNHDDSTVARALEVANRNIEG